MCSLRAPAFTALPSPCGIGILGSKSVYPLVPKVHRDQRPLWDALRSALLHWLPKGPGLPWAFLLPFHILVALLHGKMRWHFQDTQGWSPEPGPAHARRHIQGHQGQQDSYCVDSGFSSTSLVWGCFSAQLYLGGGGRDGRHVSHSVPLWGGGVGMEGKFPTPFHQENLPWF